MLILGGDFNVPLTPLLDTSSVSSCLTYRSLQAIKTQLNLLTLHDSWRTLFPTVKDYTYYSNLHAKYSRIDFFFITQVDLIRLTDASIEPMVLSDHHPITMTLTWQGQSPGQTVWRMDDSILLDPGDAADLSASISQ